MEQALERALDRAEYIIASARQRPPERKYPSNGEKSLYEKLYDIYVEECEKEPEVTEELTSNVNLLEKLLRRESLPCLVVNLYPGKEGYSLMLKGENGSSSEIIRLPYEEGELLEYLDAEELPPVLVGLLEKSQVNVFHHGCVIAEIRDYRQSSDREAPHYQSRHILLRPTMQTLAWDVEAIASDNQNWTQEDKLLLESQLILATAEPLCLDPSVSVACTANRLLYNKQKMNTLPMKRNFKRYSMASLNRQQELSRPPSPELRALTSCKRIRESKTGGNYGLKTFKAGSCVDMWKQRRCDLAVPSQVDVEKYAKGKKSVGCDDSQPTVWPVHEVQGDLAFGGDAGYQSQATRLAVRQLTDNSLASGKGSGTEATWERQLSPPHSFADNHPYSFPPGAESDAGRVVSRPEESVQESTQCPVQMSHSSSGSAGLRQPSPGKEPEQPKTGWVQSSVPDSGATHPPPPMRLPWHSGRSSWGESLTSQQAGSSQACASPGPAPKPPALSQESSVEQSPVSTLPATTLSTAGSSQTTSVSRVTVISVGLKVIREVGPRRGGQASGRGCATRAPAPGGIQPGHLPAGALPPLPPPPPPPPKKSASDLRAFPVVQLPRGSLLCSSQQPAPQPRLPQLLPLQWPCAPPPRLLASQGLGARGPGAQGPEAQVPGVQGLGAQVLGVQGPGVQGPRVQGPGAQGLGVQGPGAQASGSQGAAVPNTVVRAEEAVVVHLGAEDGFRPPQVLVLSPPGSGLSSPGLSPPQQTGWAWAAPRPQLQFSVHVRRRAAAPCPRGPQPSSQAAGTADRGPPAVPKP
ncbi:transcription factor SPT20 homolog [Tursiops truncatus]|uniref:Transcription factor SPT20 homolog n=1 Tax=Tursiops truncatus TaxID=9739 RepID=A0A2U4AQR6_TURTR|nr:transcription factor SPT20 homolog [Tursiops truncatus]